MSADLATEIGLSHEQLSGLTPAAQHLLRGGRLFQALGADPKFRPRMLEILKEADPNTPIPELDLARDMDGRVAARTKPLEDENAALKQRLDALEKRTSRDDLRKTHDLDEDELVAVDALTKDGKITDTDTAIELHRLRMATSAPRPTVEPGAEAFQAKLRKLGPRNVRGLQAAAIEEGHRVLRESRGRRFA